MPQGYFQLPNKDIFLPKDHILPTQVWFALGQGASTIPKGKADYVTQDNLLTKKGKKTFITSYKLYYAVSCGKSWQNDGIHF